MNLHFEMITRGSIIMGKKRVKCGGLGFSLSLKHSSIEVRILGTLRNSVRGEKNLHRWMDVPWQDGGVCMRIGREKTTAWARRRAEPLPRRDGRKRKRGCESVGLC